MSERRVKMVNTDKLTVKLNKNDNVATALRNLNIGEIAQNDAPKIVSGRVVKILN